MQFTPEAFATSATIAISVDGVMLAEVPSGRIVPRITVDTRGETIVDVVVKESADRTSYRYRFTVFNLDVRIYTTAIDADDDGLIDVGTPEQLNAMRYSLDGSFYRERADGARVYCRSGCRGYELNADIDLAGVDWQPIGSSDAGFNTHFNGNGYTLSNLTWNGPVSDDIGLFHTLGEDARIEGIRLIDPQIRITRVDSPDRLIGTLAATNFGIIFNSRVENATIDIQRPSTDTGVGGLVADNRGVIVNSGVAGGSMITASGFGSLAGLVHLNSNGVIRGSFATISISGNNNQFSVAGLVNTNNNQSIISDSYAQGNVTFVADGSRAGLVERNNADILNSYSTVNIRGLGGGLVASPLSDSTILNSYWDADTSGQTTGSAGTSRTTVELQSGVAQNNTTDTVYYQWNPEHWHFGNSDQYPAALYQDGNLDLCRKPTEAQLQRCAGLVAGGLSEADRAIVCRDRLPGNRVDPPYCGALVPSQDRVGLIGLEFSAGVELVPEFSPEVESYELRVNEGTTEFDIMPTAYYQTDTVSLITGSDERIVADNTRSRRLDIADIDDFSLAVRAAATTRTRLYTVVLRETTVPEAVRMGIQISALDGLNLSPDFSQDITDYGVTAYSDTSRMRLLVSAMDPVDGFIPDVEVTGAGGMDAALNSPVDSESKFFSVPLNDVGMTTITVTVSSGFRYRFEYIINVDRLPFSIPINSEGERLADADGNGLLEVGTVEQLDAMRYQPDGSGYRASGTVSEINSGCPLSGCIGYELVADLDFLTEPSYDNAQLTMPLWTTGAGWQPIGSRTNPFTARFVSSGRTISNLSIRRRGSDDIGLFGVVRGAVIINGIGLIDVEIAGNNRVGALVGVDLGGGSRIINSYASGTVRAFGDAAGGLAGVHRGTIVNSFVSGLVTAPDGAAGGLVGSLLSGNIDNSYAGGAVIGRFAGGLVGSMQTAAITNSYAAVSIGGNRGGGLVGIVARGGTSTIDDSYAVGRNSSEDAKGLASEEENGLLTVTTSYWDSDVANVSTSDGGGSGETTANLRQTISNTGIYNGWAAEHWRFAPSEQYPRLRYESQCETSGSTTGPVCGLLLPGQYTGLMRLTFSQEVLHLEPQFNPRIFDYALTLKADQTQFTMTPTWYNNNQVAISDTGGTNSSQRVNSGQESAAITVPVNGLNIMVRATGTAIINTEDESLIYRIRVTRHPYLTLSDVDEDDDGLIEVRDLRDLNAMRHQLDGSGYRASTATEKISVGCPSSTGCIGYELATSIDFARRNWNPIGASGAGGFSCDHPTSECFAAIFDGNRDKGYEISNLSIAASDIDNVGLFAYLAAAAGVRNLVLSNVSLQGSEGVGGIAGYSAGTLENNGVDGTVVGRAYLGGVVGYNDGLIRENFADVVVGGDTSGENDNIGGLVGYHTDRIFNSYAIGSVSGDNNVGGLVGRSERGGYIINSHANNRVSGINHIGGLVGRNGNNSRIFSSYALGEVSGNTGVGGLVGLNFGTLGDTYASGNIVASDRVGGLVGDNRNAIVNSYAIGRVRGDSEVGGLIGYNTGTGNITDSYWDMNTSGLTQSAGGRGQPTSELRGDIIGFGGSNDSIFVRWDLAQWQSDRNQYPILKYADYPIGGSRTCRFVDSIILQTNPERVPDDLAICGQSTSVSQPRTFQSYGLNSLLSLATVGIPQLSPQFSPTRLRYRVDVEFDEEVERTRLLLLLPTAADPDAIISIAYNGEQNTVDSGAIAEIVLDPASEDDVIITVRTPSPDAESNPKSVVEYVLELDYFVVDLSREIAIAGNREADSDGNGLIEINYLEDLDAVRNDVDGTVYRYTFPNGVSVRSATGCPTTPTAGCRGYELIRDLDFLDPDSYLSGTVNLDWVNRWDPIANTRNFECIQSDNSPSPCFNGVFDGNNHTIHNLRIGADVGKDAAGLFHSIGPSGRVSNLSLRNVTIENLAPRTVQVGSLAGTNEGTISNTRVINGKILIDQPPVMVSQNTVPENRRGVGGLVGTNEVGGIIRYSSAHIDVSTVELWTGGLVGNSRTRGRILNSYAIGTVTGDNIGGLVGIREGANNVVENNYAMVKLNIIGEQGDFSGGIGGISGFDDQGTNPPVKNSYVAGRFVNSSGLASNRFVLNQNDFLRAGLSDGRRIFFDELAAGAGTAPDNSYWDQNFNDNDIGRLTERRRTIDRRRTTAQLQMPTTSTGIYENWSTADWDFGTASQYPTLRSADGELAPEVWDMLVDDIAPTRALILPDEDMFDQFIFRGRQLIVDGNRLLAPITLDTDPAVADIEVEIYCDRFRCRLADPDDSTSVILGTTDTRQIRFTARRGNRVSDYNFDVAYDELFLNNVDNIRVDEGDTFDVIGEYPDNLGLGTMPNFTIKWSQIAGPTINTTATDSLNLGLRPQADVVAESSDHSIVTFRLEVGIGDQVHIVRDISARINKVNNAPPTGSLALQLDDNRDRGIRFVVLSPPTDIDGGLGPAMLQFQRRLVVDDRSGIWNDIQLPESSPGSDLYTAPLESGNYEYRVVAFYRDGQGYSESLITNSVTIISTQDPDGDFILNDPDIDDDNNGLIEIHYLEDLNRVRYQLDGRGYKNSEDGALNTTGCPIGGCIGYELVRDLDFDDPNSYRSGEVNEDWTVIDFTDRVDSSWQPIGGVFSAVFDGNNETISNLQINRSVPQTQINVGLFSIIAANAKVENLRLENVAIRGFPNRKNIGGIAGTLRRGGIVANSYVTGNTERNNTNKVISGDSGIMGGLIGLNRGNILNSYAQINIRLDASSTLPVRSDVKFAGGLVGENSGGGKILNSYYANGEILGPCAVGGLVGVQRSENRNTLSLTSEIRNSYVLAARVLLNRAESRCGNWINNTVYAGGLVGFSADSPIVNSYVGDRTRAFRDRNRNTCSSSQITLQNFSVDGVPITRNIAIRLGGFAGRINNDDITHGYWEYNGYQCSSDSTNRYYGLADSPLRARHGNDELIFATAPNAAPIDGRCEDLRTGAQYDCTTYTNWSTDDWFFGESDEYPSIRHAVGLVRNNPGCDFDDTTSLPKCGDLLLGQPPHDNAPDELEAPLQVDIPPQARIRYAVDGDTLTELNAPNTITIDEGETLTLDALRSISANNAPLNYLWRQASGPMLLLEPVAGTEIELAAADDFVAADADSAQVVIWLELGERNNPDLFTLVSITLNVIKRNSQGSLTVDWLGDAVLYLSEINDPDGGPFTDVEYQWRRGSDGRFVDIGGANELSYRVPPEARDGRYRLQVGYTDGQGYFNRVSFDAQPYSTIADLVDKDRDGLIEISTIEQLSAIRHQPDGSGYKAEMNGASDSSGCPGGTCRGYELVRNLDFDDRASYSSTATDVIEQWDNWNGIDNFNTVFEGNELTISNLKIIGEANSSNIGLFGRTLQAAEIRNISLAQASVQGANRVGMLAGNFTGRAITDSHVLSGDVVVTGEIGGCLIGRAGGNATISDSSVNCTITGYNTVGGLVGESSAGIERSFATGAVVELPLSNLSRTIEIGGLVATLLDGRIEDSYAAVDIRSQSTNNLIFSSSGVGGLVGRSEFGASINNSYAIGDVINVGDARIDLVGGLVGDAGGSISNSYATGNVDVSSGLQSLNTGGLVGRLNATTVDNSYASGDVKGYRNVGGLIGWVRDSNSGINNSYANGAVSGDARIGGLVGNANGGGISNSYAIGNLSGRADVGGLVGIGSASLQNSYWDIDRSGTTSSVVARGFASEVLKSATAPSMTANGVYYTWSSDNWDFGVDTQYPALKYRDASCGTATPSSNCGEVLLRQRLGLRDIRLSQLGATRQAQIVPTFDATIDKEDPDATAVRDYRLYVDSNALEFGINAVANSRDSVIAVDGGPVSAGTVDYSPALDFSTTTVVKILVSEPYEIEGKENLKVEYRLTLNAFPMVDDIQYQAALDPQSAPLNASVPIREGHFIVLTSRVSDINGNDLSYRWTVDRTQVSLLDESTLVGTVVGGSGNIILPFYLTDDFVAADRSQEMVRVSLTVQDSEGISMTEELSLPVMKHNNGTIGGISTPTQIGFTYTAPTVTATQLAEDPDRGGDIDSIGYQWQRQFEGIWSDIAGETDLRYTVGGFIADFYRVIISYTDGQGYRVEVPSAPARASSGLLLRALPGAETTAIGGVLILFNAENLREAEGDMRAGFFIDTTSYTVPTETDQITLTVASADSVVSVNGMPRGRSFDISLPLNFGNNVITVQWQDEDDNPITYEITVRRAYNTTLQSWRIAWQGQTAIDFTATPPQPDTDHILSEFIPNNIQTVSVSARISEAVNIAIDLNGDNVGNVSTGTSTEAGAVVAQATVAGLVLGENTIRFVISSPDGLQSEQYTATVWRRYNAQLEDLSTSATEEQLSPRFSSETTEYSARTANHRESERIDFSGAAGTTVVVNDVARASTSTLPLSIGDNTAELIVMAERERDTTYTVIVHREYSLNLRSLSLANAVELVPTLVPTGDRYITENRYTATVPDTTTQVTVTFATDLGIRSLLNAPIQPVITENTIRNNNADDRIETTASVPLNFDENRILLTTSALGEQRVTTITVTRLRGKNPDLQPQPDGLVPETADSISYDEDTRRYTIDVPNRIADLRLTLRPQDPNVSSITLGNTSLDLSGLNRQLDLSSLRDTGSVDGIISGLIEGGAVEAELKVIAHNGINSQTYTVRVNRALSSNDNLDYVQLSQFNEGQDSAAASYRIDSGQFIELSVSQSLRNEVDRIRLNPTTERRDANVKITKVGDTPEIVYLNAKGSGSTPSDFINLDLGRNDIRIKVTAPDRITSTTYTLSINRNLSDNTELETAPSVLGNPAQLVRRGVYIAELDRNTTSFSVEATALHPSATVTITTATEINNIMNGSRSASLTDIPISVDMSEQEFNIVVLAQNQMSSQSYVLTVRLIESSDANLASLRVERASPSNIALDDNENVYRTTLPENISATTVTAVANDRFATVKIIEDGRPIGSRGQEAIGRIFIFDTGVSRTLQIEVTAQDDTVRTYTLTITRAESSNNYLNAIAILNRDGNIVTGRNIQRNDTNPSFNVANSVAQILVRPTAEDSRRATIEVRAPGDTVGEQVRSGANSTRPIAVPEGGTTTITIVVTAQNGEPRSYTVAVNRAASADADLKDLRLLDANNANLLPNFDPTSRTQVYRFGVPNTTTGTRVTATAHPRAVIRVDIDGVEDTTTATGTIDSEFDLEEAEVEKRIRIVVTSQDRNNTRGYTVFVTRAEADSTNANLASIAISLNNNVRTPLFTLISPDEGTTATYSARIMGTAEREVQTIEQIIVSPRAEDGGATISIDDDEAASMPDAQVMLTAPLDKPEEQPIAIKVTAGDKTTSAVYSLQITRVSSADVGLATVVVGGTELDIDDRSTRYTASIGERTTNTIVSVRTRHSQATMEITLGSDTVSTGNRASKRVVIDDTGRNATLQIKVVAQNRMSSRTYVVIVERDRSSDTSLANIIVGNTSATVVANGTYTATLSEHTANTTVTVIAGSTSARTEISEGGSTTRGGQRVSRRLDIDNPGESKELRIRITAQSGAVQTYRLTVEREQSTDDRLYELALLPSSGRPVRIITRPTTTTEHQRQFDFGVTGIRVQAFAHPNADKIEVFAPGSDAGEEIAQGGVSSLIPLTEGEPSVIRILVTAQDGETTRPYVIRVTRALNPDDDLRGLGLISEGVGLDRSFNRNTLRYRVTGNIGERLTVTVTSGPGQRIIVDDDEMPLLQAGSEPITSAFSRSLEYGENTIEILVIAQNRTTSQTYILNAFRPVVLEGLILEGLSRRAIEPYRFDPFERNYAVTVDRTTASLIITPVIPLDSGIEYTISQGGERITQDEAASIALMTAETKVINVELEAPNGTMNSYRVRATRERSDNANLGNLQVSFETTLFQFDNLATSANYVYTVPNRITDITLSAGVAQTSATIIDFRINDNQADGVSSDETEIDRTIPLNEGETKQITIKVLAQDLETSKTYTIGVTRRLSSNTDLSAAPRVSGTPARLEQGKYIAVLDRNTTSFSVEATAFHPDATVMIDGVGSTRTTRIINTNTISVDMPEQEIIIVVRAADRAATQEYILTVRLADSTDVRLGSLSLILSGFSLPAMVDEDGITYTAPLLTADAPNPNVVAEAADRFATVTITENDTLLVEGGQRAESTITLETGKTKTLSIKVTAQDRITSQTYTLTVTRAESSDASLASLGVSNISPSNIVLRDNILTYTATLAEDVANTTVTAVAGNRFATVTITDTENNTLLATGRQSTATRITLEETGDRKTLSIEVIAQDGVRSPIYTLTVTRDRSSDKSLSSLIVERADPEELVSEADRDRDEYTATVGDDVANTTVTVVATDPFATVTINDTENGMELARGIQTTTTRITLEETGDRKTLSIEVIAQNGTTSTYTLTVVREQSRDTSLASLTVEGADPRELVSEADRDPYIATVGVDVANTTVTAVANNTSATVTITENGTLVAGGDDRRAERGITLARRGDTKTLQIKVTAQNGITSRTYTLIVARGVSLDTSLASLIVDDGADDPENLVSEADPNEYTVTVAKNVVNTTVTVVANDEFATVTITDITDTENDILLAEGGQSTAIRITLEETGDSRTLQIKVIAESRTTSRTYALTVVRADSMDATLASLGVSNTTPSNIVLRDNLFTYTATLAEDVANTTVTAVAGNRFAMVTITENNMPFAEGVERAIRRATLDRTGDTKTLQIKVTAQNGITSQTYTLTVMREQSRDTSLASLTVERADPRELVSEADRDRDEYTATVGEDVANTTVTVVVNDEFAMVTITDITDTENDMLLAEGGQSTATRITLEETGDSRTLQIKVIAQSRTTSQTYTLTVMREQSRDTSLASLTVERADPRELVSEADRDRDEYTATVGEDVANTTVTVVANDESATVAITLDEDTVSNGNSASRPVVIDETGDSRTLSIKVIAQNGTTSRTYTLTVMRAESSDVSLASLSVQNAISSDLEVVDNKTLYTATLPEAVANTTVTVVANDESATVEITLDEDTVSNGNSASRPVVIDETGDSRTLSIKVIAQNGTTSRTYTLTVMRAESSDVSLASLSVENTISSDLEVVDNKTLYTATLPENVSNTTVTVVANDELATVEITLDEDIVSNENSASRPVVIDETGDSRTLSIKVIAQNGTTSRTYTLIVARGVSLDVSLGSLRVDRADPDDIELDDNENVYTATLPEAVSNTTVTVVANDESATVEITLDKDTVSNGNSASRPVVIDETGGSKTLRIKVIAQNGTTSRTYTLTVMRAESSDVSLASLSVQNTISSDLEVVDNKTLYTATLPEAVANTTVTVVANDEFATVEITLDEDTVSNGNSASRPVVIDETGDSRTLSIKVIAQNGTTSRTYTLIVARGVSLDVSLGSLRVNRADPDDIELDDNENVYTATLPENVSNTTVTVVANDESATVEITLDEDTVSNGNSASRPVVIDETGDSRTLSIKVIAQNGTTSRTYTLTVMRAESSDVSLASLSVENTISSDLEVVDNKTLYTATLPEAVANTTVTVVANDELATVEITLDEDIVSDGNSASRPVVIDETGDSRTLSIKVIAQNGTTSRTYTLIVARGVSLDVSLGSLRVDRADPDDIELDDNENVYTATLPEAVSNTTVTVVANDESATVEITLDEDTVSNENSASRPVVIDETGDSRTLSIKVIAQNGTTSRTYTLTVMRAESSDVSLASLSVENTISSDLEVVDNKTSYTATLPEAVANTTVTVITTHSQATVAITLDGEMNSALNELSRQVTIADPGASKTLEIVVTAQDGTTSPTYTLIVTRALSTRVIRIRAKVFLEGPLQ